MAPIEVQARIGSGEPFPVEIDDEETVEVLANVIMSLRMEILDQPRLVHKGKVLKDEQEIRGMGISAGDTVVVVPPKPTAVEPAAPAPREIPQPIAASAASSSSGGEPPEHIVVNLCDMGFERPKVLEALKAAFNNPERAVEYLFNGIPAIPTDDAPAPGTQGGGGGHWTETMLGPQLLTKEGPQPTRQALGEPDVVALYFSAHWCPPCRQFTPMLARALAQPWPQLKVVFVSSDRDEASFNQYYSEMPWLAVPFSSYQKDALGPMFGVRGIPSLVILKGSNGQVISRDGRSDVTRNNFDIASCLGGWVASGAPSPAPAAAPAAPSASSAAASASSAAASPPPPPKVVGPDPLPIDDEAADAALARVAAEEWEVQEAFFKTGLKVLDNALQNPGEEKFRQLKKTNAALQSKLLGVADNAGLLLMDMAGFKASGDELLCLPGPPDGHCTAVRKKIQDAGTAAWEKHARAERDAKIKEEVEKDKARVSRYTGGEGDRMQIGRGRGPARGGGG